MFCFETLRLNACARATICGTRSNKFVYNYPKLGHNNYYCCVYGRSAHLPHCRASLAQRGGLTSLKRFQCLILRLYCEMVDSHCSSSMKFPASLTLFTSVWQVKPANITSGMRRHAISVISTMVAAKRKTPRAHLLSAFLLCEGEGCWGWFETTHWLACAGCSFCCCLESEGEREMRGERERWWERERERKAYLTIVKYVTRVIFISKLVFTRCTLKCHVTMHTPCSWCVEVQFASRDYFKFYCCIFFQWCGLYHFLYAPSCSNPR